MTPVLADALRDRRCAAAAERWRASMERRETLESFVDALLGHVNEMAHAMAAVQGRAVRGRVFRVGIAYVTADGLVVPLPFRAAGGASLFIDEFHVMPLRSTSLGPLLESGRGDRIDDLAAHLAARGVSLSSQVALREGVRSNLRLPWRSLDRKGLLWFSADAPRFFDDLLFEYCESLVPVVERQLRLLDSVEAMFRRQDGDLARRGQLEGDRERLGRLLGLLQVEENPLPGRLLLHAAFPPPAEAATGGRLLNLWRLDERRALLLALQVDGASGPGLRLALWLRGLFLQQSARLRSPSLVVERVEAELREARENGRLDVGPGERVSLVFGRVDLEPGLADLVAVGEPMLWLLRPQEPPAPLVAGPPLGAADSRQAAVFVLGPEDRLLLVPGLGTDEVARLGPRIESARSAGGGDEGFSRRLAEAGEPAWPGHLLIGLAD